MALCNNLPLLIEPEKDGERYSTGTFLGTGGSTIYYDRTLSRNNRLFIMKVITSEMAQENMQGEVFSELLLLG